MPQKIRIIGVPMDLGQSRRGVDMGPSALRVAGLQARLKQLGHQVEDLGNMAVKQAEEQHFGEKRAKYLNEIAETCASLAELTEQALREGFLPLVLGGDHSLAIGSLAGVANFYRKQDKKIGCLWLDAHGDMNTPESSPSGNVHGMPLAALLGHGSPELVNLLGYQPKLDPHNVVLLGLRDLDAKERRLIKESGVHAFTMRDIDERGLREVMSEALHFCTDDTDGVAVSLDMDLVDPEYAPGVGTQVSGGLTYREAHLAMEMIADSKAMLSLEIVEINPVIDLHNKTALLGVEMVLSALGKKILYSATEKAITMTAEKKKLRVGVIFGGRSGEHEVSLVSAASVIRALDPEKYEPVLIGIAKDGRWLAGLPAQKMLPEVLKSGQSVMLPANPGAAGLVPLDGKQGASLPMDVIFPVLHGTYGEDGTVQGLLELAGLPYVGSGVTGSAVGMDKDMQKRLFRQEGLPVGDFVAILRSEWEGSRGKVLRMLQKKFRFPVFVKPATLGSSVGMTKAHDAKELAKALDFAAEFAMKIVVEKSIRGREIELSVLGNDKPKASIPGEIIPHREFYDYAAKYLEDGTRLVIPAKLTKAQIRKFQDYAVRAFRSLECRGMARVDFFLENKTRRIYINEVNTIPGFTSISMYPKLWEASGLSYGELIDQLIELALAEHREKQRTKYSIELPIGAAGALEA